MAGAQASLGICHKLSNPNSYFFHMRALLVALERWVAGNELPPMSRYPLLRDGTLSTSDQASLGFPSIPGVVYNGLFNALTLLNYGPDFDAADESGLITEPPIVVAGAEYATWLPKVDADGNEIGGVRSPDIEAPIGTYTGWNLRRAGFAEGELCGLSGMFVPFATTEAARIGAGDPRPSLEARYGNKAGYIAAVRKAAQQLVGEGLLLPADADLYVQRAEASNVLP